MLNVSQVDDALIKGEVIELDNKYVQLENENVPNDNDNAKNENLENKNLPVHNVNVMIDHVKNENAQEHYVCPNYNRHEVPTILKWIIEIDEMIITNLEGEKIKKNHSVMGFKTI